ncbi:MAG: choice-of-anchor D domain-containing protein, partial [Candidatus Eiseniibacteriota bacterium]
MLRRCTWLAFPAAYLAISVAGCSDLGPLVKPKAQADLSALALDFGTVALNQSATRSVVIRNIGSAPLPITPSISGAVYALPPGTAPFSVPAGAQWTLDVTFTPSAVGAYPSTLDLGSEAPQVALSGSGALQNPGAHLTIAPTPVDFGVVLVGNSAPGTFQITSDGTAAAVIDVNSNAGGVTVTSGGGPGTLSPGDVRDVSLS